MPCRLTMSKWDWLLICGLMISAPAQAQWVKVDTTDVAVVYADPATRQVGRGLVKMWELVDYRSTQLFSGKPFRSSRVLREFDCRAREMRTLAFTIFTGSMASGGVVHSHRAEQSPWQLIEPYSVGESSMKLACAR